MLRKIFLVFTAIVAFIFSYGQSDTTKPAPTSPAPTITGSVDGYYRFNFNDPPQGVYNNYTSFTNSQNSFELGMASIRADHSFGKASATIDLGFGRRAEEFSYANPDHPTLFAVKQAYLNYAVSDKVTFTLGKWATHVGYEVTDAYLNRNYSMDYMFSYGPFSHTGLKVQIATGKKSALMLGVANETDNVTTTASPKYLIAQYSTATKNDKVKVYLNYQGSYNYAFSKTQFDVVLTGTVTDKFSVGYNGTVQMYEPKGGTSNSWWGSAVYLNLDPTTIFGITLRGEYFNDDHAIVFGTGTSIFDVTLSPNIRINNLTIIPELRLDAAQKEIFSKTDGTGTQSTVTALLAATYHF
ncbi:MAG TPA: outer membrane beta-barrel protein [Chitinophagaceae bacterium]|nr:outer membrane beta-barrel protein [Chitinophagaceae bacterium]